MRFTYAEEAPRTRRAEPRNRPLHHVLTVVLGVMAGLALWEIVTFSIEYWRALNG